MLPLVLEEVSLARNGTLILDRVSLRIEPGRRTIILGANGAGKSVMLRVMHGLVEPDRGRVEWSGSTGGPARQDLVFQQPVMLRTSAVANVAYGLKLAGVPARERAERAMDALRRVGLEGRSGHPARSLSGGEQQRLALARAWAREPAVLFLDEPTASLDPTAAREIEALLATIHATGTSLVMTTHNLGQARRLADEIVFIHRGRIVEQTPAAEFFQEPRSPEAAAFVKGELPWI